MGVFDPEIIVDSNNNNHELFTKFKYGDNTYYITRDNKIFIKIENKYIEVSEKYNKKIIDAITFKKPDVIDYEEER